MVRVHDPPLCGVRQDGQARLATPCRRLSVAARTGHAPDLLTRAQIHDHRELEPALYGCQAYDVTRPPLVRPLRIEVLSQAIKSYTERMSQVG